MESEVVAGHDGRNHAEQQSEIGVTNVAGFVRTGASSARTRVAASPGERQSGAPEVAADRSASKRGARPAIAPQSEPAGRVPPEDPPVEHADRLASGEEQVPRRARFETRVRAGAGMQREHVLVTACVPIPVVL